MNVPLLSVTARFVDAHNRAAGQVEGKDSDTNYISFSSRVRANKVLVAPTKNVLRGYAELRNVILLSQGASHRRSDFRAAGLCRRGV